MQYIWQYIWQYFKKEALASLSELKRLRQKKITQFFYYQSKTVKYCQTLLNSFKNLVTTFLLEDYNAPFTKTKQNLLLFFFFWCHYRNKPV